MNLVISSTGKDLKAEVDARFGRCRYFLLVDTDKKELLKAVENDAANAAGGAGPKAVQQVVGLGAQAVISGNFGPKAFDALRAAGLKTYIFAGSGTVEQALADFNEGRLKEPAGPTGGSKMGMR